MTDRYIFKPHTSLTQFEQSVVGTDQGQFELDRLSKEFATVVDMIHHTQSFAAGASTLVHMPDGNNIAVINIPKKEFVAGITEIALAAGYSLS